jgi:hypothetical protein
VVVDGIDWCVNKAVYFQIPLDYDSKESVYRPDDYEVVETMLLHGVASLVLVLTYRITYLLHAAESFLRS